MKKIAAFLLTLCMLLGLLSGCGSSAGAAGSVDENGGWTGDAPKYVFLFIGDGMSYPQIQLAADYLGAMQDEDYERAQPSKNSIGPILDGPEYLNFMKFPVAGSAVNYDSNSFAPDSASAATAIATGHKTYSASLSVDELGTTAYETIAEKIHAQTEMKVGIVTSVNVNHATPGAFYAHQASRSQYYNIGKELIDSGFDYFAGGEFLKVTDLHELAAKAGYKVVRTQAEAEALKASDGKVIVIGETLADSESLSYEIDRAEGEWALADYVEKGIEMLDNKNGFFMMCEGGKIDWACHANDAATVMHDVLALTDAIQVAIDFAAKHPKETLILVTGDHETGGMSIGFAGTEYDTYLTLLENQKISFEQFDAQYSVTYNRNTPFETVLADIEECFGLTVDSSGKMLKLNGYEQEVLKTAFEKTVGTLKGMSVQESKILYGDYEPITVAVTHILNNKAGLSWSSFSHTGLPVAVFADGTGAELFDGFYDNTEIFYKLADLLNVE